MFQAIKAFFAVFTALFNGTEKYAIAFNKSGDWAVASMDTFVNKAEQERALDLIKFKKELAEKQNKLGVTP